MHDTVYFARVRQTCGPYHFNLAMFRMKLPAVIPLVRFSNENLKVLKPYLEAFGGKCPCRSWSLDFSLLALTKLS